ncbi:cysteine proteinase [Obba rivulosa]|uniref:Cysteine proteinase n=1 Tax=Obba rivulosa TaxID=1052685 RepID=A0A8E2DTT2_9APHY|nr:cysteine proteinase [Obba rivulosa]
MAGSKKNKSKKLHASSHIPIPPPPMEDDELMNDLMAQLDSQDAVVQGESATVLNEIHLQKVASGDKLDGVPPGKHDSKARYKARQARRAAALAEQYTPSDPEADARLRQQAEDEERIIKRTCDELNVELFEITPDGHCLFSAVADQLALLGILPQEKASYATCRHAAADYIQLHPDDFLPFLPAAGGEDSLGATSNTGLMSRFEFDKYCSTIRNTGAWGGEPEILALCRAYSVPIHVIQGTTPSIVIHHPSGDPGRGSIQDGKVVRISYHRRMYGLGEHYNSLRPKSGGGKVLASLKSALTS